MARRFVCTGVGALVATACGGGYLSSSDAQLAGSSSDDDTSVHAADATDGPAVSDGAATRDASRDADVDASAVPDAGGDCSKSSCGVGYVCAWATDVYSSSPSQNFDPKCIPLPDGCETCGCAVQTVAAITQTGCNCVTPNGPLRPDDAGAPLYVSCSEA